MKKMTKIPPKILTLKINLSQAICNSKNEDTIFSCYLNLTCFFVVAFLLYHTIGHSPNLICQLPYIVQFCGHSHKDQSLVRGRQHLTTGFTKIISGLSSV